MRLRQGRWGKLLTLVLIAGLVGTVLGVGIAMLSREGNGTASSPPEAETTGDDPPSTSAGQVPAESSAQLLVRVLGSILHPAGTESGQQRRRARVTVRVRVENRGERVVTPARPTLLVAGERIPSDPSADSPRTHLGDVAPGQSAAVTLRFEVAGDVTTTIMAERRARIRLAGRTLSFGVTIAPPISVSQPAQADSSAPADASSATGAAVPSDARP